MCLGYFANIPSHDSLAEVYKGKMANSEDIMIRLLFRSSLIRVNIVLNLFVCLLWSNKSTTCGCQRSAAAALRKFCQKGA